MGPGALLLSLVLESEGLPRTLCGLQLGPSAATGHVPVGRGWTWSLRPSWLWLCGLGQVTLPLWASVFLSPDENTQSATLSGGQAERQDSEQTWGGSVLPQMSRSPSCWFSGIPGKDGQLASVLPGCRISTPTPICRSCPSGQTQGGPTDPSVAPAVPWTALVNKCQLQP